MKRVFIAIIIELSTELQQDWQQLKHKLGTEKVRWVPSENFHITLRFLGSISEEQEKQVQNCILQACNNQPAFSFELGNFSYFKRRGKPVVVFVDLQKIEELTELATQINESLKNVGFEAIQKFRPHLTLGRIKHLKDESVFFEVMNNFKETHVQHIDVKEVILYESILHPEGPEYKIIQSFELN